MINSLKDAVAKLKIVKKYLLRNAMDTSRICGQNKVEIDQQDSCCKNAEHLPKAGEENICQKLVCGESFRVEKL